MKKLAALLLWLIVPSLMAQTAVTLAWDANTETTLAGYKVYWGTATRNYGVPVNVGKITTYKVTGLACGVQLFFAVTAYDTSTPPAESGYSNEVSTKLLCAPTNLRITGTSVSSITKKEATVLAATNLPATMTIQWTGPDGTHTKTVDFLYKTAHSVTLTYLRPHSPYTYTLTAYGTDGSMDTVSGNFSTQ